MPKQKSDRLMQYKCFSKMTCQRHASKKCSLSFVVVYLDIVDVSV